MVPCLVECYILTEEQRVTYSRKTSIYNIVHFSKTIISSDEFKKLLLLG